MCVLTIGETVTEITKCAIVVKSPSGRMGSLVNPGSMSVILLEFVTNSATSEYLK